MIVALHSAPKRFFKTSPPHSNNELVSFVRKAASLGFKAVQIGPLVEYAPIEGEHLKNVLDSLNMERNIHVGGIYDAEKLASTEEEYTRVQTQIHYRVMLSKKISSTLVSVHPPFFATKNKLNEKILLKAKTRFFELLKEEVKFASRNRIKIALESFCYYPFIFRGLNDFVQFVSNFLQRNFGVLLDLGHLYQIGIDLSEAIRLFRHKILDIHIHDATREKDFRKATHLPIGNGTMNFQYLIDLLHEVGYNKWLTLEIRGNEEEIMESKAYLENLITK